ncbi:MAG TPA: D-glycero-beta-D-manno-heptose 1,7-bisphosphate 7-phosphatase [Gammaproteobacteria bacterium]|nr:D-glycero-beta-D-manno-heptose 1,7-bisphosphate 7-phosphatase [Gammaproteobacteria bacterium]
MKIAILDRDGVINQESRAFIKSPAEWLPLPGSLEAIAKLTQADYQVIVTTNQSGVGRGLLDLAMLNAIHTTMQQAAEKAGGKIHKIYFCPHLPDAGCNCRKPLPGMFEQLARDYKVNLNELNPPYIGDSYRDLQVGLATGCKFYLTTGVGGDGHETLKKITPEQKQQIIIVENLAAAVDLILK